MKTITIELDERVHALLEVLGYTGLDYRNSVEQVIKQLVDHAQQGVYRPGSWERDWLSQVFGYEWTSELEPGDPYGRPDPPGRRSPFQRPKVKP